MVVVKLKLKKYIFSFFPKDLKFLPVCSKGKRKCHQIFSDIFFIKLSYGRIQKIAIFFKTIQLEVGAIVSDFFSEIGGQIF